MKYIKKFESNNYTFFHYMENFFNQIINKEDGHKVYASYNYVVITNKFGMNILMLQPHFCIDFYSYLLDKSYPHLTQYLNSRIITKDVDIKWKDSKFIDFKEMNKPENLLKINTEDYKNFIDMIETSKKYNL